MRGLVVFRLGGAGDKSEIGEIDDVALAKGVDLVRKGMVRERRVFDHQFLRARTEADLARARGVKRVEIESAGLQRGAAGISVIGVGKCERAGATFKIEPCIEPWMPVSWIKPLTSVDKLLLPTVSLNYLRLSPL